MKAFGVFLLACVVSGGAPSNTLMMGLAKERKQAPHTAQQPLSVLHWWTSDSERQAVGQLRELLAMAGVQWQDAAIPGGGGVAAFSVLNSRLLSGDPPDVAHLVGATLTEWADVGLLLPLNVLAAQQKWAEQMFAEVLDAVTYRDDLIAMPLGIHRINVLLYNRRLFAALGLQPPASWAEFDAVARSLSASGIKPLAWSDQAWQVSTVFDSLLLSEGGAALRRELFGQQKGGDWMDPRVRQALLRLRELRSHGGDTPAERDWPALADDLLREAVQEKFAETVSGTVTQLAYNRVKGSVPVLRRLSATQLRSLDACARASWQTFSSPLAVRLPNLGMATDKVTRDAVMQTRWHCVNEPDLDVVAVQRQLASIFQQPTPRMSP